jgi:hypothetical protein
VDPSGQRRTWADTLTRGTQSGPGAACSWQCGGQGFESPQLHRDLQLCPGVTGWLRLFRVLCPGLEQHAGSQGLLHQCCWGRVFVVPA